MCQIIGGSPPPPVRTVDPMEPTRTPPTGHLAHFAINSDDLGASRRFYEAVFGWTFEPWGPPDFFHVVTADGARPGAKGALQKRRPLAPRY